MDFQVSVIGILLILAFYLPGYSFRKFYFSGFSTKQFGMGEWYDRFFVSIFLGMIVQYLTAQILRDNFNFNFNSVSAPITHFYNNIIDKKFPDLDYSNFRNAILYLILSMLFASIFGFFLRQIIRLTHLDIYSSTFKYANIWHYYFRGDIVKTKDFRAAIPKRGKWVSTRADILVDFEKDEKNILYSGIISQYDLSHQSDKLERIYLTEASRYSTKEGKFKDVPGDILILDYCRILNINLSYDFIDNNKGRKHKIITLLFTILLLTIIFAPVIIIPYFLYGNIGLIRTIFGIAEAFGAFLLFFSTISIISTSKEQFKKKYKNSNKTASVVLAFSCFFISLVILKLTLFPHLALFQFH